MGIKPLAEYIPYSTLITPNVVLCKDTSFISVFRLEPGDTAFEYEHTIEKMTGTFTDIFLRLHDKYAVYVDIYRDKIFTPEANKNIPVLREFNTLLYEKIEENYKNVYYFVLQKINTKGINIKIPKRKTYDTNIASSLSDFITIRADTEDLLKKVFSTTLIDSQELITYLHNTFSVHQEKIIPPQVCYLDEYLADTTVHLGYPTTVDKTYRGYLTIDELPSITKNSTILTLLRQPIKLRYLIRAIVHNKQTAQEIIKRKRISQYSKRKDFRNIAQEATTKTETGLIDTGQEVLVGESSTALAQLEYGESFSTTTITIEIDGTTPQEIIQKSKEIKSIFTNDGYIIKEEKINSAGCFLGNIVGNIKYNQRRPFISNQNIATLIPISDAATGEYTNKYLKQITGIDTPHLILRTTGRKNYYLNLNNDHDIMHTFITGPTGAGKSFLLALLASQWLQYKTETNKAKIIFFDRDNSAENATYNFGGTHYDIGSDTGNTVRFNPFSYFDTDNDYLAREWLEGTLAIYFENMHIRMDNETRQELHKSIFEKKEHYSFDTLRTSIQNKEMENALTPFVENKYGQYFTKDTELEIAGTWTTFEMKRLLQRDEHIREFIMSYLFFKIDLTLDTRHPTLIIIDEAWIFIKDEKYANKFQEWIKTLRKKSGAVIMATQEIQDLHGLPIFDTVINNCLTKILLPNASAHEHNTYQFYQKLGLNEQEILAIKELRAKRDMLVVKKTHTQQTALIVDPMTVNYLTEKVEYTPPPPINHDVLTQLHGDQQGESVYA